MAILWLLLLAFKDLEKSLLLSGREVLSGREEEIIESYLNRGDKKMKFVIATVGLCVFLIGCGGGAGYGSSSAPQKHGLDIAYEYWTKCSQSGRPKMGSGVIGDAYKKELLRYLPTFQNCGSTYISNVARYSVYHVPVAIDYVNQHAMTADDVLTGKIRTFSALKSAGLRMDSRFSSDYAQATIEYTNNASQEQAARRAQALQGLQILNALNQQQNQTWKAMTQQSQFQLNSSQNQYKPPSTTTCRYIGTSLNCQTGQLGSLNQSTTSCRRVGSNIVCDHN